MDDNELKYALQRYVTSDEPPMGITADALLSKGRRQRRMRVGASLGAGSAAAAITIAGSLVLGPFGGDSGPPVLQPAACAEDGWQVVGSPPAYPSIDAHEPWSPPTGASHRFPPSGSAEPTFGATTEPTFGASSEPTFGASSEPTFGTTTEPTFGRTTEPTPEATTGQHEADTMVCHLVAEIGRIYPGSHITGVHPITVVFYEGKGFEDAWAVGTGLTFSHNGKEHRIDLVVQPAATIDRGRFPGLTCQTRETQHTAIRACSTGEITREQLGELISGRELELYG